MNHSARPTVCHVLHSLHFGGAEVLARRFAQGLQSEYRPVFACLDDLGPLGERLLNDGIPVCVLDRNPGFDVRSISRLAQWLRDQQVNLIHAHQYAPFFYSALARWKAGRIPILFTEHGRDFPDRRRWKRVIANRVLLRHCDHVVAVGEQVRQALTDNENIPAERIEVIYNGVEAGPFTDHRAERAATRFALGYSDEHFIIIQVARLNRLKDHPTAIRSFARLVETYPQARLLLVGDGEERERLEALVGSLRLQDFVRFLGSRSDVPRLLHAADLFLLTSISEGIPLTLVEAMLARLPIVSTRVGGVPEVIVDQQCGLLTGPGDDLGLAQCMSRLMDDAVLRLRLTSAGFCRAQNTFADERMLADYRLAYDAMTTPASRGIQKPVAVRGSEFNVTIASPTHLPAGECQ